MNRILSVLVPQKNLGLLLAWIVALGGAIFISATLSSNSSQFFGTAGSREQLISFQYPVEIVRVPVVEGQNVTKSASLLEVRRSDLFSKQSIIADQIMEIQIREREALATTLSEMESLRAQKQTRLVEIDTQISSLDSKYQLNMKQMRSISGDSTPEGSNDTTNPMLAELAGLREARTYVQDSFQIRIDNLDVQLREEMRPAKAQLAELQERKEDLERQQDDLLVSAQFTGKVGSVLHGPGEQVAPFGSIMSIHSSTPSFIKGYIHESVINDVQAGSRVWIKSQTASGESRLYIGVVESIGSRIVEFPERLRSNALVSAWGTEVIVFLEEDTSLLLGEKVVVLLKEPRLVGEIILATLSKLIPVSYANDTPKGAAGSAE